ncbi:hypothetical protein G6O67_005751 [Ophiocordyceps sinensis]|uniref:AGC-kinase C-terminal domain-containing protein n=2 Tax=Ophiocordyceps sinensis TaxID=72228 RepID=A0A8H4LXJ7_9HYPO|nr:hypothetical protein G6O67_005751 [Ophiocordyceps sinensis]
MIGPSHRLFSSKSSRVQVDVPDLPRSPFAADFSPRHQTREARRPRMLSHLRFHRRGASNPASPTTDHQQPWSPTAGYESPSGPDPASPFDAPPLSSSSTSALPPTLPPITRVTSADADLEDKGLGLTYGTSLPDARPRISSSGETGFIGGVALRNYRRDVELAGAAPYSGHSTVGSSEDMSWRQRLNSVSASAEMQPRTIVKQPTSFSTPTELQTSAAAATGRRPAGTRLPSDTPLPASNTGNAEPPRSRKSLPFLKNPMSTLLMRRKNNHNVPDLCPLPLTSPKEEPIYDPRIRGTRVHDFSAPRRQHHTDMTAPRWGTLPDSALFRDERAPKPSDARGIMGMGTHQLAKSSTTSRPAHLETLGAEPRLLDHPPGARPAKSNGSLIDRALTLVEDKSISQPPLSDDVVLLSQAPSSASLVQASEGESHEPRRMHPSTRTTRSGNISLSEVSALPKHMKSTSSRFSFDMIGAAKQEKLLEERHRKRELERKSTGAEIARDSRFDEFDDDSFDYDVMMDDDGLEERIPGVNAELEDDDGTFEGELDPDNDQENFAGFVFQRSNSTSALASPQGMGIAATPRDASGKVIGFAMTKDTPSPVDIPGSPESQSMSTNYALSSEVSGLGIRAPAGGLETKQGDDLYFNDGLIDPHGEFAEDLAVEPEYDTAPFDESIFDNNDTDRFGRPVPGAFAQAQELRRALVQDTAVKRESDITSRFSVHSGTSRSTAHTSPCVEALKDGQVAGKFLPKGQRADSIAAHELADAEVESVAAYQAALAAAAHQAVVSGKFRWASSSHQVGEDPQSPLDGSAHPTEPIDDGFGLAYDDMDEFDMDDDAIIAEANASALANDSDEWYGQEFGFYSNPLGQHHTPHSAGNSSKGSDYEYANGGFFGTKGMGGLDRSTSGRMISREPNLTPITERSEYSNRNSLMSLGFPPLSSSTPMIQSPGLAQLAMMADRGDEHMTLSALLRLRSRAWGGSQASLASSKEGSPLSERGDMGGSPWNLNVPGPLARSSSGQGRKSSFLSTTSCDSEAISASGSPTLTMAMPALSSPCPARPSLAEQPNFFFGSKLPSSSTTSPKEQRGQASGLPAKEQNETCLSTGPRKSCSDVVGGVEGFGMNESLRRLGRGHHRHNSSADSVSYLKEEGCGETRWIMERRRTGESGEVEILEREVVEGCRI